MTTRKIATPNPGTELELAALLRSPQGVPTVLTRPDGTALFTLDAGTGPPVLLVHGYAQR